MLRAFLLVGMGGFLGSVARYGVSLAVNRQVTVAFPVATFAINILGCLLIGLLSGLGQRYQWMQQDGWLVLATGFCGGFTTFSAFALEGTLLLDKNLNVMAVLYMAASVVTGLLLCRLGMWLVG